MRLSLFKLRRMINEELTSVGIRTLAEGPQKKEKVSGADATKKVASIVDKKIEGNEYNEDCKYGSRFYNAYAGRYGGQDALIIASSDNSYPVVTDQGAFKTKEDMAKAVREAISAASADGVLRQTGVVMVSRDDKLLSYLDDAGNFNRLTRDMFAQNVYVSVLGAGSGD